MRLFLSLLAIISSFLLSQCSTVDFTRRVAQQGNLLPQDKISRLKLGMSKEQVAIVMGTSLLSPTFDNNRWDYAYTWRRGQGSFIKKSYSLFFKNDRLTAIEPSAG